MGHFLICAARAVLGEASLARDRRLRRAGLGRRTRCRHNAAAGLRLARRRNRCHLRTTWSRERWASVSLDGIAERVSFCLITHIGNAHLVWRRERSSLACCIAGGLFVIVVNHRNFGIFFGLIVVIQRIFYADEHIAFDTDVCLHAGTNTIACGRACVEVVDHMNLAKSHAGHTFLYTITPPVVVCGNLQGVSICSF